MALADRELAWLDFNLRVLEQAEDSHLPAMERLRFLSIFQSNLDEFYMKRLAFPRAQALVHQDLYQKQRVQKIYDTTRRQLKRARECSESLKKDVLPKHGIYFLKWADLKEKEKEDLALYFKKNVLPLLTPLSVDSGHPFPHISTLSTSFAVRMTPKKGTSPLFARVKIPKVLPSYIRVERSAHHFHWLPITEVIKNHMSSLFPGMSIEATLLFRITRNIEFERDEEEAEDILEMIANELRERKFGHTVKFQCQQEADPWLLNFLKEELELKDFDIFELGDHIDYTDFLSIYAQAPSNLKFNKWKPLKKPSFSGTVDNLFSRVKEADVFLHHPYESYKNTVEKLIVEAASDPKVLGIKVSLYRTDQKSRLIQALLKAIENGKEVVCVIEVKARLDEENNISWANVLENAGAHIVYGMVGLKTHCKIALITRKEEEGLKCYAHIGTGNYNADTAAFYTDVGIITANEDLTEDIVNVFHFLTGHSNRKKYNKLLVAPVNMRDTLEKLIENEIANVQKGLPAEISIKLNNLEDKKISELLEKAADQGVSVNLGVRSICVLQNLKGLKNLKIHSIVDQFLEHSRIFYFRAAAKKREDGKLFMGSADLMTRNLDRRVEVITPILSLNIRKELLFVLDLFFKDNSQKWILNQTGLYKRVKEERTKKNNFQLELRRHYLKKNTK